MKRIVFVLMGFSLLFAGFAPFADAHPGRTDSSGGHTCWTNCAKWGLKTGEYHYHNGGGSSATTKPAPKPTPKPAPKPAPLVTANVFIDGKKQNFNQSAYIKNGTTLVPMRGIFESLGASVQWESSTKKVTAKKGNTTISLTVGNKKAYVKENGVTRSVDLSHPSEIRNGSTMVPLRFISESLGATVQWDGSTNTVKINK